MFAASKSCLMVSGCFWSVFAGSKVWGCLLGVWHFKSTCLARPAVSNFPQEMFWRGKQRNTRSEEQMEQMDVGSKEQVDKYSSHEFK